MSNKTKTVTTEEIIAQGNEPIDTVELGKNVAMKQQQLSESIDASIDIDARAEETQALTPNLVEDRIVAATMALNHVFFDPELRQKGDNGYNYRLDYDGWDQRVDGARPTGEIVTVDRLSFLGGSLARGVCQTLDNMLNAAPRGRFGGGLVARGNSLRSRIQSTVTMAYQRGEDASDDLAELERKLANNVEQTALVRIALNKAVEAYHSLTGQVYQTAQDKAAAAESASKSVTPEQRARLTALGVSI